MVGNMKIIKKKRHTCIYTFNMRVYIKSNLFMYLDKALKLCMSYRLK